MGKLITFIFFTILIATPIYVFVHPEKAIAFKKCRFQSDTVIECVWLLSE